MLPCRLLINIAPPQKYVLRKGSIGNLDFAAYGLGMERDVYSAITRWTEMVIELNNIATLRKGYVAVAGVWRSVLGRECVHSLITKVALYQVLKRDWVTLRIHSKATVGNTAAHKCLVVVPSSND